MSKAMDILAAIGAGQFHFSLHQTRCISAAAETIPSPSIFHAPPLEKVGLLRLFPYAMHKRNTLSASHGFFGVVSYLRQRHFVAICNFRFFCSSFPDITFQSTHTNAHSISVPLSWTTPIFLFLSLLLTSAATPLAVKRDTEPSDDTPPVMRDLGATPTSGKENADAFHRLSAMQICKESSPNTLAAEATAIAGITALLTEVQSHFFPRVLSLSRACYLSLSRAHTVSLSLFDPTPTSFISISSLSHVNRHATSILCTLEPTPPETR